MLRDRYRVESFVDNGAFATVWRGRDTVLDSAVALKRIDIPPGFFADTRIDCFKLARREAMLAHRVRHEHVIRILDVFDEDKRAWLIMEFVSGGTLESRLRTIDQSDSPQPAFLVRVGSEIAGALAALHQEGIVHRDIKPQNVLLDANGSTRVTDFGVASMVGVTTIVGDGRAVGTQGFMAPEVLGGSRASAASDVYALGATLYRAMTGEPPRLRSPEKPGEGALADMVMSALATEPDERPTPQEIKDDLELIRSGRQDYASTVTATRCGPNTVLDEEDDRRRLNWAPAGVVAAVIALIVVVTLWMTSRTEAPTGQAPTAIPTAAAPVSATATSLPPPAAPRPSPGQQAGGDPALPGASRWNTFWSEAWYSPFAVSSWTYDDGVPTDAGFFRGLLWLIRLIMAIVFGILIDLPLTLAYTSAAVIAVFLGPGPAHILVGPLLFVSIGFLFYLAFLR